jgi:hypothetical protein
MIRAENGSIEKDGGQQMVSQEGHSAQLLKVKRDEAPAGGSSREQAHGGLRDADTTKRLLKVPRLRRGRWGEGRVTWRRVVFA